MDTNISGVYRAVFELGLAVQFTISYQCHRHRVCTIRTQTNCHLIYIPYIQFIVYWGVGNKLINKKDKNLIQLLLATMHNDVIHLTQIKFYVFDSSFRQRC